jgi:hypothetical protein
VPGIGFSEKLPGNGSCPGPLELGFGSLTSFASGSHSPKNVTKNRHSCAPRSRFCTIFCKKKIFQQVFKVVSTLAFHAG